MTGRAGARWLPALLHLWVFGSVVGAAVVLLGSDHLDTILIVAFAAFVASDVFYLVQIANGTYRPAGIVDVGWLLACALGGLAAWTPEARAEDASATTRLSSIVPSLAGCTAIGLLVVDQLGPDTEWLPFPVAVIAALIFLRFTLISHDNHRLIAHNRTEAVTDALTGLANRRRLLEDLPVADERHRAVILFDLDGFKSYNDTFGHPAGDALLQMIGRALADAIPGEGRAYRLGGDEFCAVLPAGEDPDTVGSRLAAATARDGHGFNVGASFGATTVPAGAPAPERSLGDADERLYVNKNRRRTPADEQSTEVLLAVLAERTPDLNDHAASVADLAAGVAERLGLDTQRCAHVRRAAALHDIGKMAIPDAILAKPGPLDESEWHLMRQHTVIGERILAAAPALRPVAEIVRASHERWDGHGYPDQVAGEDIPLGARIVFACDAFDAMTAERAYNRPRTPDAAVAELRACAGTQFDPAVVDALAAEIEQATASTRGPELSPAR